MYIDPQYLNIGLFATLLIVLLAMGEEGRHHLYMRLIRKGISFIKLNPVGSLQLQRINWNGEYFEDRRKKNALFFNFDLLSEPEEEDKRKYNEVLKQTAHWHGSRTPVLMGYDVVDFVSNPQFLHALEKAKQHEYYEGDSNFKQVIDKLAEVLKEEVTQVSFIEPFKLSTLREYVESSTAAKQRTTYEKGKVAGVLQMAKKETSSITKYAIPIGMVILILLLLQSGVLNTITRYFGGG